MISIIIPNHNRKNELRECLGSVISQDCPDKEIIVVDDGSIDGSADMVEEEFPEVRLVRNFKRLGACKSRNLAIGLSGGDYVWFLDNDSVAMDEKLLGRMVEKMRNGIGCIGGEGDFLNNKMKVEFVGLNGRNITKSYDFLDEVEGDYITTANCLVRKEDLIKAGGFDETYWYLFEDIDLGLQMKRLGLKNIVSKDTLAFHKFSLESRFSNFYLSHRNRIYFIWKNFFFRGFILPVLDFFVLIDFRNYLKIKSYDIENSLDLLAKDRKKRNSFLKNAFLIANRYITGLIIGHVWNFFYLPRTICYKTRKKSFL